MGQVVKLDKPLEKLVLEIRGHVHDAGRAESTCAKHQLQAGLRLIELRARIEREGGDWWPYYEDQFTGYIKSRKYAEKLMKWARSDDPDAARDADLAKSRDLRRQQRANGVSGNSTSESAEERTAYNIVTHALRLVGEMDAEQLASFEEGFNALLRSRP